LPETTPEGFPPNFTVVGAGLAASSWALVAQTLPECHVLECAVESRQVVEFCGRVGPAILIVDYESLLRLEGRQVPAVEVLSTVQVLVLCRSCDEGVYKTALAAGCSGVIPLDSPAETLRRALKAMSEGELWYPRAVLSALARGSILNMSGSQKRLTARETEILRLLGMDQKNQAIADQLFISRETVRWHLRALYAKLGVSGRDQARRYALSTSDFAVRSMRPN
jgi:NarL family two-component system response regulator LiaR